MKYTDIITNCGKSGTVRFYALYSYNVRNERFQRLGTMGHRNACRSCGSADGYDLSPEDTGESAVCCSYAVFFFEYFYMQHYGK